MFHTALKNSLVKARIETFESMTKTLKDIKYENYSSLGRVSRLISLFETEENKGPMVYPSFPQTTTKVAQLRSIFDTVDKNDCNTTVDKDMSERRCQDVSTQTSSSDIKATKEMMISTSPELEKRKEFNDDLKAKVYIPHVGMKTSAKKLGVNGSVQSARQLSTLGKNFIDILVNEGKNVDEIQQNEDGYGQNITRRVFSEDLTTESNQVNNISEKWLKKSSPLVLNIEAPGPEARRGLKRLFRRSGNRRSSGVRKMLMNGLRALKVKLSQQNPGEESYGQI